MREAAPFEISRLVGEETDRAVDECVYLIGRPPLNDFRHFMAAVAQNGHRADERRLIEEWRAAAASIAEL